MRRPTARTVLLIMAVVLALGGASTLAYALSQQHLAPPVAADIPADTTTPSTSTSATPSATPSAATTPAPTPGPSESPSPSKAPAGPKALGESVPTTITIPSIKVHADVITVGLKDDGEIETPDADPDQAGWFQGGHTPGAYGSAIIVGHVTWNREPTVFYRLDDLKKGDTIMVKRTDGSQATFAVNRRSTFPKDEWPADQIFAPTDDAELTLITCGGRYDTATHTYGSNVIVWTTLISTKQA